MRMLKSQTYAEAWAILSSDTSGSDPRKLARRRMHIRSKRPNYRQGGKQMRTGYFAVGLVLGMSVGIILAAVVIDFL